jgi:hypothetical protein
METNLRRYLIDWLNDWGLDPLADKDIRVASDERYPNLYNLKYGTILADKSDPIVRACRGAVVERVDNDGDHSPYFRLVAYAFDRFFNLGEGACHELDWANTKIYEKSDGSLIKLFFYEGDWIVSTSGSVAARSDVGSTDRSFEELFWSVFNQVGYSRGMLNSDLCYIFELCHQDNRIVVDYKEPQLPLLAVRDRSNDFEEIDLEPFCESVGFKAAESYVFGSMDMLTLTLNQRGADHEGFVLFDGKGRAKVKSDIYVQLHRVRGNGDPDFSELYLNGDLEEFLLHFPEYRPGFEVFLQKLEDYASCINKEVARLSDISQKEFAQFVMKNYSEVSGAMFAVRADKYRDFGHYLESMTPKQLDRLLKIG